MSEHLFVDSDHCGLGSGRRVALGRDALRLTGGRASRSAPAFAGDDAGMRGERDLGSDSDRARGAVGQAQGVWGRIPSDSGAMAPAEALK